MRSNRRMIKLKARMFEMGITQQEVANAIGKGLAYTCRRCNGWIPWNIQEMTVIGTMLELPREQWLDYFSMQEGA